MNAATASRLPAKERDARPMSRPCPWGRNQPRWSHLAPSGNTDEMRLGLPAPRSPGARRGHNMVARHNQRPITSAIQRRVLVQSNN